MKICLNCRAEEEDSRTYACKVCDGKSFEYKYSDHESDIIGQLQKIQKAKKTRVPPKPYSQKMVLSDSARIAIESARIVNVYGSVLQIIGIIAGVLWIILGIIASYQIGWLFMLGLTIGGLTIAISAVQGAFLRMISNYVKAKLEIASSNN